MLTLPNWQLANPINAIIFDCDGTLSTIEGIDELARQNQCGDQVAELTEKAMGQTGINPEIYHERLKLVNPTRDQVIAAGKLYYDHLVPDVDMVIDTLLRLNKKIYIVSAGLKLSVSLFGQRLKVPKENIFAVDIQFDSNGHYLNYDSSSPLTVANGKIQIAQQLMQEHQTIAHIGDGMNDFVVRDVVTRFIGYGGTFHRPKIEAGCEFYIKTLSLAGLLPLLLTHAERDLLTPAERELYNKGMTQMSLT